MLKNWWFLYSSIIEDLYTCNREIRMTLYVVWHIFEALRLSILHACMTRIHTHTHTCIHTHTHTHSDIHRTYNYAKHSVWRHQVREENWNLICCRLEHTCCPTPTTTICIPSACLDRLQRFFINKWIPDEIWALSRAIMCKHANCNSKLNAFTASMQKLWTDFLSHFSLLTEMSMHGSCSQFLYYNSFHSVCSVQVRTYMKECMSILVHFANAFFILYFMMYLV